MQIKFFNLQKNKKTQDNQPDYRITFKNEDTFIEGGACWIKKDKSGNSFLSCKLSDLFVDHTGAKASRNGWHIEEDRSTYAKMKAEAEEAEEEEDIGF